MQTIKAKFSAGLLQNTFHPFDSKSDRPKALRKKINSHWTRLILITAPVAGMRDFDCWSISQPVSSAGHQHQCLENLPHLPSYSTR